jgi:hypothetical protein
MLTYAGAGHTGEVKSHALVTYADVCLRMQVLGHTGEVTSHDLLTYADVW